MSTTDTGRLDRGLVIAGELIVIGPLDQGGMGAVYLVEQKSTGKIRALKVMHRAVALDPALRKRFEREAKVGARIESDHIVDVLAAGVDVELDLPYLVMELLEGETLAHKLIDGPLRLDEARVVFEQLCHAVGAAHVAGVVHRDLKPENIFLAKTKRIGETFVVKVLDFGIAKVVADATSATECGVGSPRWMAPEQTEVGPVGPAADVWSLGLVAFEILTGKSFWRAINVAGSTRGQLLREIVLDPIPAARERARELDIEDALPPAFDAWFAKCVTREPGDRFRDAREAWDAMKDVFAPESIDIALSQMLPAVAPIRSATQRSASWRVETPFTTVADATVPAPVPKRRSYRRVVAGVMLGSVLVIGLALGLRVRDEAPRAAASAATVSTTTFAVTPTAIVLAAPTATAVVVTSESAIAPPPPPPPTSAPPPTALAVVRPVAPPPPAPIAKVHVPAVITTTTFTTVETNAPPPPAHAAEVSPDTIALLAAIARPRPARVAPQPKSDAVQILKGQSQPR